MGRVESPPLGSISLERMFLFAGEYKVIDYRHVQVPAWRHGGNVAQCNFAAAMIFHGVALFSRAVSIIAC